MSKNVNYLEIYDMVVELAVRHSCSLIHLLGGCFCVWGGGIICHIDVSSFGIWVFGSFSGRDFFLINLNINKTSN